MIITLQIGNDNYSFMDCHFFHKSDVQKKINSRLFEINKGRDIVDVLIHIRFRKPYFNRNKKMKFLFPLFKVFNIRYFFQTSPLLTIDSVSKYKNSPYLKGKGYFS